MITIKKPNEIELLRKGGRILAEILQEVVEQIKPGVSTQELNKLAEKLILKKGGIPSFKGYQNKPNDRKFPTALCTSINDEIVHAPAVPGRILKKGDILGLDLGMKYPAGKEQKGLYTDMAVTISVDRPSQITRRLLKVTKKALEVGIEQIKPGNYISDISKTIQKYVESQDFEVVRSLVGHGLGYQVHEEPRIPNYLDPKEKPVELKQGMVLAIEPMVTVGSHVLKTKDDGWTATTVDGSLTAHFEHTVLVTKDGHEILTKV